MITYLTAALIVDILAIIAGLSLLARNKPPIPATPVVIALRITARMFWLVWAVILLITHTA